MKKIGFILLAAVFLSFIFVVGKNGFTKALLASGLSKAAHVPVSIKSARVELKSTKITLRDLIVKNPSGFPESLMLRAPEIGIDFDMDAFWKGKTHFQEVKLDLAELIVIRNKEGQLNVDALRPKEGPHRDSDRQGEVKAAPKFLIDRLILTVGKVTYKDYSMGSEPVVQEFNIGIQDREYRAIDNLQSLVSLIMFETLTRTTLANLANLDLGAFQKDASGILSEGFNLLGSQKDKVQKVAQDILGLFK